jgi:poly(3-hydroxyalkanoate) synthetase
MLANRWLRPVWALDGDGCVPAAVVRESFHALRPEAIKAVRRALRRRRDPAFRSVYDPLSRWAYEQRRIPGALFFDTVELYRTNALYEEELTIDGRSVGLDRIRIPILLGLALRDHIVLGASSQALAKHVRVETVDVPSGHVSMLSGDGGRKHLWPALIGFFERHGEGGQRRRRSARAGRRTTAG